MQLEHNMRPKVDDDQRDDSSGKLERKTHFSVRASLVVEATRKSSFPISLLVRRSRNKSNNQPKAKSGFHQLSVACCRCCCFCCWFLLPLRTKSKSILACALSIEPLNHAHQSQRTKPPTSSPALLCSAPSSYVS